MAHESGLTLPLAGLVSGGHVRALGIRVSGRGRGGVLFFGEGVFKEGST